MKRLILLTLLFLAVGLLFSAPAHDARFLKVAIVYEMNDDGSWDMTCEQRARLDTYFAFNRALGETFIVYNPEFQKLEVLKAETTMADGRKVQVPENAFNEVLPRAAHGFADFSHLREMVITHTGLERGAVIDLAYRIRTKPGFLPGFMGREVLGRPFPVDEYTLEIRVPAARQLYFAAVGFPGEMVTESVVAGPVKKTAFRISGLAPLAHEPLAPTGGEPFLAFSLVNDWGAALALAGDRPVLPAVLAEKVDKLRAQNPALADLLAALQKVTAAEINDCGLGIEVTGWQARTLERVVQSHYATRLEKALLLAAMLKKAGVDSEMLAVSSAPELAALAATPLQLEEFWLKVPAADTYLDPCREQHEFFPYALQGRDAWNFAGRALEKLPQSNWEDNGVEVAGRVQLTAEGASGTLSVAARGLFNRYNEAAADNGKFFAGLLRKFFPVTKVEVKRLLELTRRQARAEVAFSGTWLKADGSGFLCADALRLPGLSENLVVLEKRATPLAPEAPFKVSLQLELKTAPELKLEYGAQNVERRNGAGHFVQSLSGGKNGLLRCSVQAGLEKARIAAADYPLLRELFLPYFAPDLWMIFKVQKPQAD